MCLQGDQILHKIVRYPNKMAACAHSNISGSAGVRNTSLGKVTFLFNFKKNNPPTSWCKIKALTERLEKDFRMAKKEEAAFKQFTVGIWKNWY